MRLLLAAIRFKLVLLLSAAGHGQKLLDPDIVTAGGSFKLTCNAQKFVNFLSPQESSFTEVKALQIHRKTLSMSQFEFIGHLLYHGIYGYIDRQVIPEYRNWTFKALSSKTYDKNSMEVNLQVTDVECVDAGTYRCRMNFSFPDNSSKYKDLTQNLTVEANVREPIITADQGSNVAEVLYFDVGAKAKLRCTVKGPQFVEIAWIREIKNASHQKSSTDKDARYEHYPVKSDISPALPEQLYNQTGCPLFEYTSELGFQVTETDINRRYMCLAVLKGVDMTRRAVLIALTKKGLTVENSTAVGPNVTSATAEASFGIMDIVIGVCVGLALLLFIIGALIYWKMNKSKGTIEEKPVPSQSSPEKVPSVAPEEPLSLQTSFSNQTQEEELRAQGSSVS